MTFMEFRFGRRLGSRGEIASRRAVGARRLYNRTYVRPGGGHSPTRTLLEGVKWRAITRVGTAGRLTERVIREALRHRVLADTLGARGAIDEFWVPRSNERADMVVIGRSLDAFEIKSERDTLRRLPRQVLAYAGLFDRCTLGVAQRHSDRAAAMLPDWWGITTVCINGSIGFRTTRKPRLNAAVDPEILVRLLWRDEVMMALLQMGHQPDPRSSRSSLWEELLHAATLAQLRALVRKAILRRDPERARIETRRFRIQPAVAGAAP